jgi:hypothetical protein
MELIELLEVSDEIAAAPGRTGVDNELARDVIERALLCDLLGLSRRRDTQVRPHLGPCTREIGVVAEHGHEFVEIAAIPGW